MKIDRRKTYYIVLDTEACNTDVDDMKTSLVYDLGFAVVDKEGNVYETRNLVIYDIYAREKELMKSAYYADKLPQYEEELKSGVRKMVSIMTAKAILAETAKKYNVRAIVAHNARFDVNALNVTIRYITKSKVRYFLPYGIEIWDTMKMANDTICKQKAYIRYCNENGYLTAHKKPQVRKTAEILYRYLTHAHDFVEKHTGLEDVLIEKEILTRCLAQHKKMKKALYA